MTLSVVILRSAEIDLKNLQRYIVKNFGRAVWQASYTRILRAIQSIQVYPLGGAIPDELDKLNLMQYRQVIAGKNRIVYEVRGETIYIHIICDMRKDMKSLLTNRLLRTP